MQEPKRFEVGQRVAGRLYGTGDHVEGVIMRITEDRWGREITFENELRGPLHGQRVSLREVDVHPVNESEKKEAT